MGDYRRTDRLNELFREELARLLRSGVKDPRVRTVTVTAVRTTPDLMRATVFIRTLGDEVPAEEAIRGLESAAGYIRRELGRELRLRRIPELEFQVDRTLERARRIDELLREVREGEKGGDEVGGAEARDGSEDGEEETDGDGAGG